MFLLLALLLTVFSIGLRLSTSGFSLARKVAKRNKGTVADVADVGLASATHSTKILGSVIRILRDLCLIIGSVVGVIDLIVFVVLVSSAGGFLLLFNNIDGSGENIASSSTVSTSIESTETGVKPTTSQDIGSFTQLINKTHPLASDYVPANLEVVDLDNTWSNNTMMLDSTALANLRNLVGDAKTAGYSLMCVSGYRSYDLQSSLFNSAVSSYGSEDAANMVSARAGQSEHQSGLAMDLSCASEGYDLQESFGSTPEGVWLKDNAYKYGFIIRYPSDKVSITKYSYEPWHIRYVGVDVSTYMQSSGECFEEFLGILD
jgi:D-alanyl-D-alanine carboxypeptidase